MNPRKPESHCADIGWSLIALGVVAWDLTMPESLTHGFERYRGHPVGRIVALGSLAITAAHLIGDIIPRQWDPFYVALELHNERPIASIE